jgi:hypothetical protein
LEEIDEVTDNRSRFLLAAIAATVSARAQQDTQQNSQPDSDQ